MMKKHLMFCCLSLILIAGCGKKKKPGKGKVHDKKSKLMAQAEEDAKNEIPLYTAENENLLDNENIVDFAFVDDEDLVAQQEGELLVSAETQEAQDEDSDSFAMPLVEEEGSEEDLLSENEETRAADEDLEFERVQFSFNHNSIGKDQVEALEKDITLAKKAAEEGKTLVVQGHTCQMGSASFNLALSQKRAEAVKTEMVKNGVPEENIKTLGLGYESPLVWTDETQREKKIEALSPNRRAEVLIEG